MAITAGAMAGLIGLSGGIGLGSNLINQFLSYNQNKKLMEKQQQWLENMSNTAYQRAITDAKNAGINPILVTGNGGATTPSAGLNSAQGNDYAGGIASTASAISQMKQTESNIEMQQAQTQLAQEQSLTESTQQRINIAKAIEQEGLNSFLNDRQKAELKKLGSEIINLDINSAWMKAKQNAIASEVDLNTATAEYNRRRTGGHSLFNADTWIEPIGKVLDRAGIGRGKFYGR